MDIKKLYSFNVNKTTFVNETRQEDNKTITEKVSKLVPVEIILKKPTPRDAVAYSAQYKKSFGKNIREGLITEKALRNSYEAFGGVFSKEEHKNWVEAQEKVSQTTIDFQRKVSELGIEKSQYDEIYASESHENEELIAIIRKLKYWRETLREIRDKYTDVFDATAENAANNDAISKVMFDCTYISEGGNRPVKMFAGEKFEDQQESLYNLEEKNDEVFKAAYYRVLTLWSSFYIYDSSTEEQLKKIDNMITAKDA